MRLVVFSIFSLSKWLTRLFQLRLFKFFEFHSKEFACAGQSAFYCADANVELCGNVFVAHVGFIAQFKDVPVFRGEGVNGFGQKRHKFV